MKVSGSYPLAAARERAYTMLQDPVVLARCMPGCEGLERMGEDQYAMRMKVAVAMITGRFKGKVTISDQNPPERFRMVVEGSGKIGFLRGEGLITLDGASVAYDGEVQVGGTLANVGQRLMDTTARMLIKRFFDRLAAEVRQAPASAGAASTSTAPPGSA